MYSENNYAMDSTSKILDPLLPYLKWGSISKDYLGFSRGWIYQRLNGYDGNGNATEFTKDQKEKLSHALLDLSCKIKEVAEKL